MTITTSPQRHLLFAAIMGAAVACGIHYLLPKEPNQQQKLLTLENRIKELESALSGKEEDLRKMRLLAFRQNGDIQPTSQSASQPKITGAATPIKDNPQHQDNNEQLSGDAAPSGLQVLKDLGTNSVNDPRSFPEKVNDLLATDPTKEKIAIVSKGIFDMANDHESLPDYALQSIYHNQSDPDLKRVAAQVLSLRGNNSLIEDQITEIQARLKSSKPAERQDALANLAKTHSANAATAIAPLLQDPDINVKLDALLALRATGNQTHTRLVEGLVNDPDPAVSSLASDVISNLKNLSESARTTLSNADIAAELLPIANP